MTSYDFLVQYIDINLKMRYDRKHTEILIS